MGTTLGLRIARHVTLRADRYEGSDAAEWICEAESKHAREKERTQERTQKYGGETVKWQLPLYTIFTICIDQWASAINWAARQGT